VQEAGRLLAELCAKHAATRWEKRRACGSVQPGEVMPEPAQDYLRYIQVGGNRRRTTSL
jgi:hypothetical protein